VPAFLDTNVLVYAFDEGEPEKREVARRLVDKHLIEGDGMLSVQVLREFYAATRKPTHPLPIEKAVEAVGYLATFSPIAEDARMVVGAVRRSRELTLSFWDALIVEAALRAGADRLLTEDLQHGQQIEGLVVENPFGEVA
jgi:predicted nucleic acid-binding protein